MKLIFRNPYLEPDVGMPQSEAQRYFRQLISGVVSFPHFGCFFLCLVDIFIFIRFGRHFLLK